MTTTDPILMPSFPNLMIHPRWYHVAGDMMDGTGPSDWEAVETQLRKHADVPPSLRNLGGQLDRMYPGRAKSDARARLIGLLTTDGSGGKASKLKRLFIDEHACNVEAVELRKGSELKTFLELVDDTNFSRLRALVLRATPSEEQLERLGSHPKLAALETLIIHGNLGERFETLAKLPLVAGLRHLGLWYALDRAPRNATKRLAEVAFTKLHTFSLTSKNVMATSAQGQPFLQATWVDGLRHLTLNGAAVNDEDIAALAERPVMGQLETFSLDSGRASSVTLCALLSKLSSCTHLNLMHFKCDESDADFGVEIAEALVASGCVPKLVELQVGFSDEAMVQLENSGLDRDAARNKLERLRGWVA